MLGRHPSRQQRGCASKTQHFRCRLIECRSGLAPVAASRVDEAIRDGQQTPWGEVELRRRGGRLRSRRSCFSDPMRIPPGGPVLSRM